MLVASGRLGRELKPVLRSPTLPGAESVPLVLTGGPVQGGVEARLGHRRDLGTVDLHPPITARAIPVSESPRLLTRKSRITLRNFHLGQVNAGKTQYSARILPCYKCAASVKRR